MITGWLLKLIGIVILWVISLLPDVGTGLPTGISDAITAVAGYINAFSFFFPFATLFEVVGVALTFEVAVLLWRMFNWTIKRVKG
jgi:hypothetical protein